MTGRVAIIVPTYGRPERVRFMVENINATTTDADFDIVFVCEQDDTATIEALDIEALDAPFDFIRVVNTGPRSYAGAVNTAARFILNDAPELFDDVEWFFLAADDVIFHPDWLTEALQHDTPGTDVIGTNDLGNAYVLAGQHATHYLLRRSYVANGCTMDGPPGEILHEGYSHNFTDTEAIGTAKARGVWQPCLSSVVEHAHYTFGKAQKDSTYEKTEIGYSADAELYGKRKAELWAHLLPTDNVL